MEPAKTEMATNLTTNRPWGSLYLDFSKLAY